jgi:hypothetical protein
MHMSFKIFAGLLFYFLFVFGAYLLAFYFLVRNKERKFFKSLEEKLKSDNPMDRISAAIKLSTMGIKAKDFIPKLVDLLEDKNEEVVNTAKDALIEIRDKLTKAKDNYDEVLILINKSLPKCFSFEIADSLQLQNELVLNNISDKRKPVKISLSKKLRNKRGKRKK